jgi:selenocysteine lyase/cysteine desulfurase
MVLTSGIESIAKTIQERVQYLYHQLQMIAQNHQQLQLHHPPESGIVTFWIEDIKAKGKASMGPTTATILKDWLWQLPEVDETTTVSSIMFDRFEVSVVPATSTPFDSAITGVPDMVRASVSYTTTTEALDRFCDRIQTWMMLHS